MAVELSECVILLKSCEDDTNLHKELRQVVELLSTLIRDKVEVNDIPSHPSRVYIETYRKNESNELWIKILLNGSFVLCDMKCPAPRIFDLSGNIMCPACRQIINVTLPGPPHFIAREPRVIIHVKRKPQSDGSAPKYELETTLIQEIIEALEVLVECISTGCDTCYRYPFTEARFTKIIPDRSIGGDLVKLQVDAGESWDPEIFDGIQMNDFSNYSGQIECDKCGVSYN